jgi:two-component system, NtrC family, response regulator GlrR
MSGKSGAMSHSNILLIDCNPRENTGETLEAILKASGIDATLRREVVADLNENTVGEDWPGQEADGTASVIFLILAEQETERGGDLIQQLTKQKPWIPIIVVINDCGPLQTLELLQKGASDFITPPIRAADTLARTWRLLNRMHDSENPIHALKERVGLKLLVGNAESFLTEVRKIPLIARCDSRVLITGETGTGKEMCARAIHYLSARNSKPFVPVNCAAIPAELVENELFGHERGAFTGAHTASAGLIRQAEGGTLFLDEIDCLPLMAQAKLLRFLQEKEYRRLGSSKALHADVRTIVASNAVLEEAVQQGRVRQDLYYRLNVLSIDLPPLRKRREDIPSLSCHFLDKYANGPQARSFTPEALRKLTLYDWPGNVRELEHAIERAVMFCETPQVTDKDIVLPTQPRRLAESFRQAKAKIIEQFEKDYIQKLLVSYEGNISRAAQAANKNRRAFWELIRKHRVDVTNYKRRSS